MNTNRTFNRGTEIDVHEEYLKKQILTGLNNEITNAGRNNQFVDTAPTAPSSQGLIPAYGYEDIYLYFDSFARNFTSDIDNGEMQFNVTSINKSRPLSGVVRTQIRPFYFPRLNNAATSPDFFFFGKLYMRISEFSSQAVYLQNSQDYHFELNVENLNSIAVLLNPVRDTIFFTNPFTSIDNLTVQYRIPAGYINQLRTISLPRDIVAASAIPGSNPAQFTLVGGSVSDFVSPTPSAYPNVPSPLVAVYINDFTSADSTINAAVNNRAGLFVSQFNASNNLQIAGLDLTALAPGNYPCTIYIPKNRIAFELRFTCLRSDASNYLLGTNY